MHSDCSSFWMFESHQTSSIMLDASSTRCVDCTIRQQYSSSWILDRTCVTLCTSDKKQVLCTSLSVCGTQGVEGHYLPKSWIAPESFMLGVCEGYDRVEAVSEGGLVCTTSNCLPVPLPLLMFLPLFVVVVVCLLHLFSSSLSLNVQFLPQFLQVLTAVLLVLLVRVPF